jgi:hypothetical protein
MNKDMIRKTSVGLLAGLTVLTASLGSAAELQTLDQEAQDLKRAVLDLGLELTVLEEELLYPADTQLAIFVSMDMGEFFALDSVELKLDGKDVSSYLYTEREIDALNRGGVHKLYVADVNAGEHELVAFFTGKGPHQRDYRRGAVLSFEKSDGAKYVELNIADSEQNLRPEFAVREWD